MAPSGAEGNAAGRHQAGGLSSRQPDQDLSLVHGYLEVSRDIDARQTLFGTVGGHRGGVAPDLLCDRVNKGRRCSRQPRIVSGRVQQLFRRRCDCGRGRPSATGPRRRVKGWPKER